MNALADFHFIRPGWFLLVPVVLVVWWLGMKARDVLHGWRRQIDPELLGALTTEPVAVGGSPLRSPHVMLIGWLVAVVAIAGPTWRPEPSPFADDPVPVMLLLGADESMDREDLMPSRMERARLKVVDFANGRKGLPVGLIAYSGSAHLVLPPTRDTAVVATMAAEISPEIMPKQGDDLPAALRLAEQTLGPDGGSIVVVTDDVMAGSESGLESFRRESRLDVSFLAIAREGTPEMTALRDTASRLGAGVTVMTPDLADVDQLIKRVSNLPRSVGGESPQWAESGWWLVPVLAFIVLASFRREQPLATGRSSTGDSVERDRANREDLT